MNVTRRKNVGFKTGVGRVEVAHFYSRDSWAFELFIKSLYLRAVRVNDQSGMIYWSANVGSRLTDRLAWLPHVNVCVYVLSSSSARRICML